MAYQTQVQLDSDNALGDSFGRLRISQPVTLFDSKLLNEDRPLIWDEALESGAGITSTFDADSSSIILTSTLNTAGLFTRQTFMSFNYQPGKSQLIDVTGNLGYSGGGTGVKRRLGYFNDNNGLFFEYDDGVMHVVQRSSVSGSPVDTRVAQTDWNYDKLDGAAPSRVTIDWTKSQIFLIDFEWLSVGRVRFGVVVDGKVYYVHIFNNANTKIGPYMRTPNLPIRYQMETTASSPASEMSCICSSIISEGGNEDIGILHYFSTGGTHLDANSVGTIYALIGLRLKAIYEGTVVKFVAKSILPETNDNYEWIFLWNPVVAGTFTYNDEPNSALQSAFGVLANTVTGGTPFHGGFSTGELPSTLSLLNSVHLGMAIDGTPDELVLCVRPLTSNLDVQGSITVRELL